MLASWKKSFDWFSIVKSRDSTLPAKIRLVKAMVFPVVIYRCETWTIKKAESQRIDAFELWCGRRLLRVFWTARRSNQSILKEIGPEYSLEYSLESLRVGHDWATSLSLLTFMLWRRKWQPTPVLLPGEFQGWGSLVGCHLWGRTESDTTEAT